MCGRYVIATNADELIKHFGLDIREAQAETFVSYNIAPSQTVPIIHLDEQQHKVLSTMQWGLLPHWVSTLDKAPRPINARVETLQEKPTFRASLAQRRCLVPASGFYEWDKHSQPKQPYYFYKPQQTLLAFAGLWSLWEHETSIIFSFTIITTVADDSVKSIHDRMPILLEPDEYDLWLNDRVLPEKNLKLNNHPVSLDVNKPQHNKNLIQAL